RDEFRRLVLVEDKLATNSEGRRKVLAQIFDYAREIRTNLELLDEIDDHADWVNQYRSAIVRKGRSGDVLLIVCGDRIHEDLMGLVESYVDSLGPARPSDIVLLEM